jgi:hypothetical protein
MFTAAELQRKKTGMVVYYTTTEFNEASFSYSMWERVPIYGRLEKGKKIFEDTKALITINKMISCAFFHELILRCLDIRFTEFGYTIKGKTLVLQIIRGDQELREIYHKFLFRIKRLFEHEEELLNELRQAISK